MKKTQTDKVLTVRMAVETHERLRAFAFDQHRSINNVILLAIDAMVLSNGHKPKPK